MGILPAVSCDVVMLAGAELTHLDHSTSGDAFHIAAGDFLSRFS